MDNPPSSQKDLKLATTVLDPREKSNNRIDLRVRLGNFLSLRRHMNNKDTNLYEIACRSLFFDTNNLRNHVINPWSKGVSASRNALTWLFRRQMLEIHDQILSLKITEYSYSIHQTLANLPFSEYRSPSVEHVRLRRRTRALSELNYLMALLISLYWLRNSLKKLS